jgi:ABC-type bacteriocin/lantibiotic exporter with double-glycine peptidase domain
MLYFASPSLFGVTIGILPVIAISGMKMSKFSRSVANTLRSKQAQLMSFAVERIDCISTVMLNGKEDEEKNKFCQQTTDCQALVNSAQLANGAFMAFTNLATNISLASILFFGGRLIRGGKLTPGALSGFAMQSVFVGLGFSGLATVYTDYTKSIDAASR